MARMTVNDTDFDTSAITRMRENARDNIRQIVMAGATAAEQRMADNITQRRHVRTGDMLKAVGNNGYREGYMYGATDVYPQGDDRKGIRNADKAFIINYGRGGVRKQGAKMGDRFITGDEKRAGEVVHQAMQAESDRILADYDKE